MDAVFLPTNAFRLYSMLITNAPYDNSCVQEKVNMPVVTRDNLE